MGPLSARAGLAAALVLHLSFAWAYLVAIPAFEAPDETDHLRAVWFLERTWTLPVPQGTAASLGRPDLAWREHGLGHHPPLYYGILAAVCRFFLPGDLAPTWRESPDYVGRGGASPLHFAHGHDEAGPQASLEISAFRVLRAFSVLVGLAVVWGAWALARELLPGRPAVALAAALGVACLPQWSAQSAVLDNGNLAAALAAPALVLLARTAREGRLPRRRGLRLGLWVGLALMAKLTALAVLLAGGLMLLAALIVRPRTARPLLPGAIAAAGGMLLLAGWWFARNRALLGDWTGEGPKLLGFASNRIPEGMAWTHLLGPFPVLTWHSCLGLLGWQSLPLPGWLPAALAVLPAAALLGWALSWRRLLAAPGAGRAALAALLCLFAAGGLLVGYNLRFYQPQGRYLFAALPAAAALAAAGLAGLLGRLPPRWARAAAALLGLGWLGFGLGVYLLHARPGFALPPPAGGPFGAALAFGLATEPPPARRTVRLLEPPDGAGSEGPPEFAWELPAGWEGRAASLHFVRESGLLLGATQEWLGLELRAGRWRFDPDHWAAVPRGERLRWKVRVVPDRSRGEAVADMPESGFRTLRRR